MTKEEQDCPKANLINCVLEVTMVTAVNGYIYIYILPA